MTLSFHCDFVSSMSVGEQNSIKITLPLFNVSVLQRYHIPPYTCIFCHIGNYLWHVFIYVSLLLSPLWEWMECLGITVCLVWGTLCPHEENWEEASVRPVSLLQAVKTKVWFTRVSVSVLSHHFNLFHLSGGVFQIQLSDGVVLYDAINQSARHATLLHTCG